MPDKRSGKNGKDRGWEAMNAGSRFSMYLFFDVYKQRELCCRSTARFISDGYRNCGVSLRCIMPQ